VSAPEDPHSGLQIQSTSGDCTEHVVNKRARGGSRAGEVYNNIIRSSWQALERHHPFHSLRTGWAEGTWAWAEGRARARAISSAGRQYTTRRLANPGKTYAHMGDGRRRSPIQCPVTKRDRGLGFVCPGQGAGRGGRRTGGWGGVWEAKPQNAQQGTVSIMGWHVLVILHTTYRHNTSVQDSALVPSACARTQLAYCRVRMGR
jgi:hypothetical protein